MPNEKSLFYSAINQEGNHVLINKRQIETAINKTQTLTSITMISGNEIQANLSFGDLASHLIAVEHTSGQQ